MKIYSALTLPFIARIFVCHFENLKPERQSMWEMLLQEINLHLQVASEAYFTRKNMISLKPGQPFIPCFCKKKKKQTFFIEIFSADMFFFFSFVFSTIRKH